jgi:hypothetical protein
VELATSGQKKEKNRGGAIFFSFFRAQRKNARTKKEKKMIFFLFFVSGSRQLQPDQPGLQRARKNCHFSTISVRFGYNFCAFLQFFRVFAIF